MFEKLAKSADSIIQYGFYALFFATPLLVTPFNYELFEFNKMLAVYAFSTLITGAWIIKMIAFKKVIFRRSPLDIPLLLFLLSLLLSTFFSIDRHVSIWGYYSRFNGGLLSIISYLLLYFSFVTNFPKDKVKSLIIVSFSSAVIVSIYGVLEHFGIDKNIWVQDVQNRVFSTLGQPNWLAAYLAILIPIAFSLGLDYFIPNTDSNGKVQSSKFKVQSSGKSNIGLLGYWVIGLLGYWVIGLLFNLALLFTKSRSGFMGFWLGNATFWVLSYLKYRKGILKFLLIFNFSLLIFNFLFGSPFSQLNRFTLPELMKTNSSQPRPTADQPLADTTNPGGSLLDVGITESGDIRNIVWRGAIDIVKHYPLLGTGPETFAFSYYKYRPVEHNMTSEWDFLYNKAHNEFLNYAATTGLLGLGSYLLIIGSFIWWNIKQFKNLGQRPIVHWTKNSKLSDSNPQPTTYNPQLLFALFSGWLTIHVTNFFGFSVVITQLFFYLIPAMAFVLSSSTYLPAGRQATNDLKPDIWQKAFMFIVLCFMFYVLFSLARFWWADKLFAAGFADSKAQKYSQAFTSISSAINTRSDEPLFYDELTLPSAVLAVAFWESGETTTSAKLVTEAINANNTALSISPANVNFWKGRTRLFYTLSRIDEKYLEDALTSLEAAHTLAPTDPKITYNLGLLYDQLGKEAEAYQVLEKTVELKPDYRDAHFALGLFYMRDKKLDRAKESFEFILNRINPNDEEAKEKLEELK